MICSKCNAVNQEDAKFCDKCGNVLDTEKEITEAKVVGDKKSFDIKRLFTLILSTLVKPVTTLKERVEEFDDVKTSLIIGGSISLICTIISLVRTMINSVITKEYEWLSGYKTVIKMENLLHINYISVILKSFIVFAVIIAICALIYYLAGIILRKKVNYIRLLGITSTAVIPLYLVSTLISPILSNISSYISVAVTIIAFVYSVSVMIYAYNNELKLKGNMVVYVNAICLSVMLIMIYVTLVVFLFQTIGSVLSMF